MASPTLESIYTQARGLLHDTQVVGGEVFTDTILQPYFGEAYRRLFSNLMGTSKRVERTVYVNLPANTSLLIPATAGISDMQEPELMEERKAANQVTIVSTTNATPISVNAPSHGQSTNSEIIVTDVSGTTAPWGQFFVTVTDTNNFTLNGSMGDGSAGTGGYFTPSSTLPFTEVLPIDLANQGLDGTPTTSLGVYLWENQQFYFRGATETQQLRITYWASGNPPTITSTVINIDNSTDFLATAAAAGAAFATGWDEMGDRLYQVAYGNGTQGTGLIGDFIAFQVRQMQRGPQRRQLPFRAKRSRFGSYILG